MARASNALETRERALETLEPSYIARPAKRFFISEAHGSQRAASRVAASEPTPAGRRGSESSLTGRRGLELQGMRHRWSPPRYVGEVRDRGERGSAGACLDREVRSRAAGRMTAPELQKTWQHLDVRPAPCLDLKTVCGCTRSAGYQ
jgi:hypothetical protein